MSIRAEGVPPEPGEPAMSGRKGIADRLMPRLGSWARRNMDILFMLARNVVPILIVRYEGRTFALVSRNDDVREVLSLPDVFQVPYAPKLRVIMGGGNIFLGMNDEPDFTRDKSTMRIVVPREEAMTRVKPEVERLAEDIVDGAGGRLDIAMQLTQAVTTRFFTGYFGTPAADPTEFSDWARILFKFQFVDVNDDPAVRAEAEPVARRLREQVDAAIAERKAHRGERDDVLERCLQLQDDGFPGLSDEQIRNNLIGFIVGGMPQPPMIVPQLFDVLLDRPRELAAACQAARADDDELVAKYVFEALRFYPLTPGLFRICAEPYRLAAGTWRARTIPAGATVLALTRSAMLDGRRVPAPRQFRFDRPEYAYMHFGHGMHVCFGLYINQLMVPAICKAVLKKGALRRAPGADGTLQMDGAFAKRLVVEYD
jgi:cytochrome P450